MHFLEVDYSTSFAIDRILKSFESTSYPTDCDRLFKSYSHDTDITLFPLLLGQPTTRSPSIFIECRRFLLQSTRVLISFRSTFYPTEFINYYSLDADITSFSGLLRQFCMSLLILYQFPVDLVDSFYGEFACSRALYRPLIRRVSSTITISAPKLIHFSWPFDDFYSFSVNFNSILSVPFPLSSATRAF